MVIKYADFPKFRQATLRNGIIERSERSQRFFREAFRGARWNRNAMFHGGGHDEAATEIENYTAPCAEDRKKF